MILSGLLLILSIGFGYILSYYSYPLNPFLLNMNKLIALAFVISIFLILKRDIKFKKLNSLLLLISIMSGVFIISLFITGALLSIGKETNTLILLIHNIATLLIVLSTLFYSYLILKQISLKGSKTNGD